MRKREYHWSLYHTKEKNQLDGLRTDQVEVVFAALSKEARKEWFVWKESAPSWKPLEDFPLLLASLRKADDRIWETPPVPHQAGAKSAQSEEVKVPKQVSIANADSKPMFSIGDSEVIKLSLLRDEAGEERHNVRFQKKIDVRIVAGDQILQNTTVDISLRGMSLKNPLPASLPTYYTIEIKHDTKTISLVCSTIANPDGSPSRRARIEANEYSSVLFSFLLSGTL